MALSELEVTQTQASLWLYAAWLVSLAATLGALFIGEVLGQTPCVLCWYQRIAMFPLVWILGVACLTSDRRVGYYALPLALIGGVIALCICCARLPKEWLVSGSDNGRHKQPWDPLFYRILSRDL